LFCVHIAGRHFQQISLALFGRSLGHCKSLVDQRLPRHL